MIQHSVIFRLKHPAHSPEETAFLAAADNLRSLPGVQEFQSLRQISPKNPFHFGLSMKFADQQAYAAYNEHPDHARFVETFWARDVDDFLEIDFEPINSR